MLNLTSRNTERKANYARMASEQSKEARNAAISAALGEGEVNVEGKMTYKTVIKEVVEVITTKSGKVKEKKKRVHERVAVPFEVKPVGLPTSETRSAKRARRKARDAKLVKDVSHPNGRCGNIGCRGCSALPLALNARPGSRAYAERK